MSDVLIIGGGIIGMLTARELLLGGATVTLLEKGETARESSWAGGGILSPLYPWRYPDPVTRLASHSQGIYPQLAEELKNDTGVDPEYLPSGLLVLDEDELEAGLTWSHKWNIQAEAIDRTAANTLEPALECPSQRALWLAGIGQIRNPRLARALRNDIDRRGAHIHVNTPVSAIQLDNSGTTTVETSAGRCFTAEHVVVCAGAWTEQLLGSFGAQTRIEPVRGQMIMFHAEPGLIKHITLTGGRYAIPRKDGRILFGSTLEHTGFEKQTTPEARESLYHSATELFPALRRVPIENHWAGLRPGAPAGIPYIGRHPDAPGLIVNAGHFRNGVVLGPASARLAADLILERETILDPAPYALTATRPATDGL